MKSYIPLPMPVDTDLLPAAPHGAAPLQPELLSASAQDALHALRLEAASENTTNSYQSALRYWAAWYWLRYGQAITLPLPANVVLQFVADHSEHLGAQGSQSGLPPALDAQLVQQGFKGKRGALAHSTLVHRIAVLSKAHSHQALPNPCHSAEVREALQHLRKAYARRGMLEQKKAALTRPLLEQLLATCDDSLRGRRDRALLLFAWASGGRRRSEVADARMEWLQAMGPGQYLYDLRLSKTNQSGSARPENFKPVVGVAGAALAQWLEASGIREGAIFRRVFKNGQVGDAALSALSVNNIVKERCALAGVEGDFSAHSLRSGFVTEAGRQNMALADTMAMTGHQSAATVLGYFRAEAPLANKAARLLDDPQAD
ncbi:site-specific integrase [Comamonas sp. B-9]|uniref:site-specific integrase n=1 Tax=Comamonas sp. B-9 TaxID=1055192 RepID=UPI000A06AFCE|nr:site-specific integrase [Comamonas sp. B-9]